MTDHLILEDLFYKSFVNLYFDLNYLLMNHLNLFQKISRFYHFLFIIEYFRMVNIQKNYSFQLNI